jgi:hypothetical protein
MATKEVSTVNSTNYLIISDNDQNQVIINQPNSNIIQVTIPQNANNITQNENIVVVNDPSSKQINIIDQGVRVIQLTTLGPQGPQGPQGIPGPVGNPFPFTGSAIISGSLIVTGSIIASQGFTGSLLGTSSYALTASFALNGGGTAINTGSFVTTSSFNNFTASVNTFTSSYNTGSFSGSFIGTSSYSNQSLSASYALTASFALNAGTTIDTGSFVTTSSFNNLTSSFNNFTSSYNTGSFTGSFTGSLAGTSSYSNQSLSSSYALTASFALNGGSGISSYIATGSITASVDVNSPNFQIISGSSTLFNIDNTGLATISSSLNIGTPTDGGYSTGFFDTFTNNTKVSDAIDEISAAFLDLAPAKAGTLTSTNLILTSPTTFSGYLAGGLNSTDWYVGTSAYSLVTTLVSSSTVVLNTTESTTRFRAGKNSDLVANTLIGGVTSSKALGSAALSVSNARALSSGTGSTGTIQITDIAQYNTFWVKSNARINDTLTLTGSYKYTISADNGAGTTNNNQLWFMTGSTNYPNQTVTTATPTTSSTTLNYLSGVSYLKTATFTLEVTGSNLFNPVYNQNQISFTSTYFTTLSTGSNTPNFNDTLLLTVTRSLNPNLNSGQSFPTFAITGSKPGKTNSTTSATLVSQRINSYTASLSTNNTNSQSETFFDETRRYTNLNTSSWASGSTLIDGNLQVQNGRLINGRWGDYVAFVSGSSGSAATTYANYFRDSIPGTANRISGTGSLVRNANAFAVSTPISAWDSGGRLEAVLVLKSDITGPQTANVYYDLGRPVGSNVLPTIIGIRSGVAVTNTPTTYTVIWALPSGVNTGANGCVLWIRYRNTPNTDFITSLSIIYS